MTSATTQWILLILKTDVMEDNVKRAQVIMLPTEDKSTILLQLDCKPSINLQLAKQASIGTKNWQKQHLYIISEDEIKKGDWFYNTELKQIIKATSIKYPNERNKIIATTDTSLKRVVPQEQLGEKFNDYYLLSQPSQQFIEKYIESYNKGEVITDVLVEYERHHNPQVYGTAAEKYSVVDRLKINPKDNTITIKKLKDSWNREEVEELLYKAMRMAVSNTKGNISFNLETWIKENL